MFRLGLVLLAVCCLGCAADVATSAGTAAQNREEEIKAAEEKKQDLKKQIEQAQEQIEQRKQELEDAAQQ